MRELSLTEEKIYNSGERLIPEITHDLPELVRHQNSYLFFRRIIQFDRAGDDKAEPIRIIDLGCGVGHGCATLASLPGVHIVGVDSSVESIEFARNHYARENITYEVVNLVDYIPVMPEFDYVVSRNVFEHLPNGLQLALSTKWRKRLIFDVPYNEAAERNPYHMVHSIREEDFRDFPNAELFFQDLDGVIYDPDHKPARPNVIACIASHAQARKGDGVWATNDCEVDSTLPMKLALLSPAPFGPSSIEERVLLRLLRTIRRTDYCVLLAEDRLSRSWLPSLPSFSFIPSAPTVSSSWRVQKIGRVSKRLLHAIQRVRHTAQAIKQHRCDAILACSGNLADLPTGYLASRLARVPFYAYLFEDYAASKPGLLHRLPARILESAVLRGASGVLVANEYLSAEYRRRYRIVPEVIHSPCVVSLLSAREDENAWPTDPAAVKVVYAGSMRHSQEAQFLSLLDAIRRSGRTGISVHLYTDVPLAELRTIQESITYHDRVTPVIVPEVYRKADIIYVPLSFAGAAADVVRTFAPLELGDCLASGRPILVNAPAESFVSQYVKQHECGLVVNEQSPESLAAAIDRLLNDADLRQRLGENARAAAKADFGLSDVQATFVQMLRSK